MSKIYTITIMMTRSLLLKLSLWAGLDKDVREAIAYSVREGKTKCELWFNDDNSTKKILERLGFEVEVIVKEGLTKQYLSISWETLEWGE